MNVEQLKVIHCGTFFQTKKYAQNNKHYPTAVNTIQITVQIYSDIVQLFVQ